MRLSTVILFCAPLLAACGDPLRDVPRLSGVDIPEANSEVQALPDADETGAEAGFFSSFFGKRDRNTPSATGTADADAPAEALPDDDAPEVAALPDAPGATVAGVGGRGLFGGLFGAGGGRAPAAHPDVAPDVTLPYGKLARLCDVPRRELGSRVATYPERRAQFTLYDTDSGSTAPHTFYVTGFDDGCARQFTGALAMFGSPVLHEQLRYGLPAKVQPYSTTDEAYETLKTRICGVREGQPCGRAMSRLERNTAFLAVYERFGSNQKWKTILLHDGEVLATDVKD